MQDLRSHHRQALRKQHEQQAGQDHRDDRDESSEMLVSQRVHRGAGRHLAYQRSHGAGAQRKTDLALGPMLPGEVDRDERPERRLQVGHEEVQPVQALLAVHPERNETHQVVSVRVQRVGLRCGSVGEWAQILAEIHTARGERGP